MKATFCRTPRGDGGGQADEATEPTATPPRPQGRSTPPNATIFDRPAPPFSTAVNNVITYCQHAITNAVAEGLTSLIMAIKRRAGGYRNPTKVETVVYFYCGGLRLYPSQRSPGRRAARESRVPRFRA
ncbi:MAG: transposase [Planctomycetes bacterium]|nr:transposase [Planctomycetota bacterium]